MDILYLYRRSSQEELELRYSLRSVARHLPWIRKVWIFGDRPAFLAEHAAAVTHVPQEYTARIGSYRVPVVNLFLQIFLGSLIPDLAQEFLLFADDYFLLDSMPEEEMRKDRALEDLANYTGQRGRGPWHEALWRTHDLLARFGLPVYNFESHVPAYLTKARVLEGFCAFRDFITEDRFYGPLALTAILNFALKRQQGDVVLISQEQSRAGFYAPADLATIQATCAGKKFLNFDDAGFNADMRRYLEQAFPEPSAYESPAPQVVPQTIDLHRGRFNQQYDLSLAHA